MQEAFSTSYPIQLQTGLPGTVGPTGPAGAAGANGANGSNGNAGAAGLSAYQQWLAVPNVGSEAVFLASLKGAKGDTGAAGAAAPSNIITNAITLTNGNDGEVDQTNESNQYLIRGTASISSANWSVNYVGDPSTGQTVMLYWDAVATLSPGLHIFILGTQMPDKLAGVKLTITAVFNGTTWVVAFLISADELGIIGTADLGAGAVTTEKIDLTTLELPMATIVDLPLTAPQMTTLATLTADHADLLKAMTDAGFTPSDMPGLYALYTASLV